MYTATLCAGH